MEATNSATFPFIVTVDAEANAPFDEGDLLPGFGDNCVVHVASNLHAALMGAVETELTFSGRVEVKNIRSGRTVAVIDEDGVA